MRLQVEYEFTLPKGYNDENGSLHKQGSMRLATAGDEILPLKDPRVQNNPAYAAVITLSRVVSKLGTLDDVNPRIIEGLFLEDFNHLQELYRRVNGGEELTIRSRCPECGAGVEVSLSPGEPSATPSTDSTRR